MQRNVGRIDVEDQILRRHRVGRNELIDQYPIQGNDVAPVGPPLQPTQGRAAAQFLAGSNRRLH